MIIQESFGGCKIKKRICMHLRKWNIWSPFPQVLKIELLTPRYPSQRSSSDLQREHLLCGYKLLKKLHLGFVWHLSWHSLMVNPVKVWIGSTYVVGCQHIPIISLWNMKRFKWLSSKHVFLIYLTHCTYFKEKHFSFHPKKTKLSKIKIDLNL